MLALGIEEGCYWIAPRYAPHIYCYARYDGWIEFSMTLKATHEGKGKLFLDGWKEEDLYSNLP
jgi:hypothetical protein